MLTVSRSQIKTYPFPQADALPSFQFRIHELTDNLSYDKPPDEGHKHQYYEIFLLESGHGTHMIDHEQHSFGSRSVHIVQPGVIHLLQRNPEAKGKVIIFSMDVISGDDNIVNHNLLAFYNNQLLNPVVTLPQRIFKELMSIVGLMQSSATIANRTPEFVAYVRSLFSAFLLTLKPNFTTTVTPEISDTAALYNLFSNLVEQHYSEGQLLKYYATRMHISEKTLSRIVRKHANQTPAHVIRDRILLEACRLLNSTSLSVKEIAYMLHFSDPAHFIRVFKQGKNCTPQEYRLTR
jgi:AraC-like DNA-binding protein